VQVLKGELIMTKRTLRYRLLTIVAALGSVAGVLHAQGVYSGEGGDDDDDIFTSLTSYGGSCGEVTITSTLNGSYAAGANVYQEILASTPGSNYIWDWGYSVYANAGIYGCILIQANYSFGIGLRVTFEGPPTTKTGSSCSYTNLACALGTTASCPFLEPYTTSGSCPNYAFSLFISLTNTGGPPSCFYTNVTKSSPIKGPCF
jgi:hypothetical protein